jgi:hypothetical protein
LLEEVSVKLEDPAWLIKVKNQLEAFQKDATKDLKRTRPIPRIIV